MKYRGKFVKGNPLTIETKKQKENKIWQWFLEQTTYDYFVVLTPTKNFPLDEVITGINKLIHRLNVYYYTRHYSHYHITGVIKKEWGDWKSDDDWRRYFSDNKDKKNKIPWEKILHYHLLLKVNDWKEVKLPEKMKLLAAKIVHMETVIKPKKGKDIFHSEILGSKEELLFQEPDVERKK